jgi:hypothetical protein
MALSTPWEIAARRPAEASFDDTVSSEAAAVMGGADKSKTQAAASWQRRAAEAKVRGMVDLPVRSSVAARHVSILQIAVQ